MSEKVLETLAVISAEIEKATPNVEKIGLLARSIRWQKSFDKDDKAGLLELGTRLQQNPMDDAWVVERTIFEVLCTHAEPQHVPFLADAFRMKGKHGDDRRRFALQALSSVLARFGDAAALEVLLKGLSHVKKDTRGWTIGFLMDGYLSQEDDVPDHVIKKLVDMMRNDKSPDVRVEASRALADIGFIDAAERDQVYLQAKEMHEEKH